MNFFSAQFSVVFCTGVKPRDIFSQPPESNVAVIVKIANPSELLTFFVCVCLFSDSDAEGEDLAQPEFRGLWEEGVHKVSL